MKNINNTVVRLAILVVLSAFVSSAMAALEEDKKDEKAKNIIAIVSEKVEPRNLSKYLDAQKLALKEYKKHGLNVDEIKYYQTEDLEFHMAISISSLDEVEKVTNEFNSFREKYGKEKWKKDMDDAFDKTVQDSRFEFIRFDPSLSYMPEKPRLKEEEKKFYRTLKINLSNEKGAYDGIKSIAKDVKKFYQDKSIPTAYEFYWRFIGGSLSDVMIVEYAKDAEDYFAQEKVERGIVGNGLDEINKRFLNVVKDFSYEQGWVRRDLSYFKE